jgi:shikimate kinase
MTVRDVRRGERIYLTGFMGSGKSTIGPILANSIGYEFADLDALVEAGAGMTVAQIFREKGEEAFRAMERSVLAAVAARSRLVVALGGGVLTDPSNLALVTSTGIMVYLRATPEDIAGRLRRKRDRPLILGEGGAPLGEEALRDRIRTLLAEREGLYARAEIIVDTDSSRLGLTVDKVVHRLSPFLPDSPPPHGMPGSHR